ncbi:hypothetical protein K2P56_00010 [Patescibacteria group bacterium]|nr:hypothetical protein [Patescibacteria group bacterium]
MKKILALVLLFSLFPQSVFAATVVFLTSGTSYTIPSDWTTTNTIECIGSGGNGRSGSVSQARGGGGGGAYSQVSGLDLSGSISYVIGAGGNFSTGTYFNGVSSTSASISCSSGRTATQLNGGAGGTTANSIGTIKFAGGNGEVGIIACPEVGGGGGGAGGPGGAGEAGVGSTGGRGGGGFGGGFDGGNGAEWNYGFVAGSGGGGFGSSGGGATAGDGGLYGGGGGGGGTNCVEGDLSGVGTQGIIVISYWPTLSSMINILGGRTLIQGGAVRIY